MTTWLSRARGLALAACLAALAALPPAAQAQDAKTLGAAQQDAVRALVREFLLNHPEVVVESLQRYDAQRKAEAAERQRTALSERQDQLTKAPGSPVLGNPEGDVVVVEFFDYRCPYCKKVAKDLRKAVRGDGKIRMVMKEFPILGPDSLVAARAALAAEMQGRYEDFHFALMAESGPLNERSLGVIAERLGLDVERLRRDMSSQEVEAEIRQNYELAKSLDIGGTPAFVIGDQIYPGAIGMDELHEAVASTREGAG